MKRFIPQPLLLAYHATIAWVSQLAYGFPARRLITIGVTGTDGKTSTVNYISQILEAAGHRTGFTSTATFKIGERFSLNPMKMTMPGRWTLARLLHQIKKSGAEYAIVENTSEGLRQFRHLGIDYDLAVFTNLSPEHIESHGSFENYRKAKEKLFARLSRSRRKSGVKKIAVANLDDPNAKYFLAYDADEKWGFSLETDQSEVVGHVVRPVAFECRPDGISFTLRELGTSPAHSTSRGGSLDRAAGTEVHVNTKLVGIFNLKNMLAATTV